MDEIEFLNNVAQAIYDKKGRNIVAIDVQGISTLTNYFIIAEGNVDKHVQAIGMNVMECTKKLGMRPVSFDGYREGHWIVLDFWQVIVHLFAPGYRDRYQLERLWSDGVVVDLQFSTKTLVSKRLKGEALQ